MRWGNETDIIEDRENYSFGVWFGALGLCLNYCLYLECVMAVKVTYETVRNLDDAMLVHQAEAHFLELEDLEMTGFFFREKKPNLRAFIVLVLEIKRRFQEIKNV